MKTKVLLINNFAYTERAMNFEQQKLKEAATMGFRENLQIRKQY